jgi:hypothetical protein
MILGILSVVGCGVCGLLYFAIWPLMVTLNYALCELLAMFMSKSMAESVNFASALVGICQYRRYALMREFKTPESIHCIAWTEVLFYQLCVSTTIQN